MAIEHVSEDCQCEGKWCAGCKNVLCIRTFNHCKASKDGLQTWCRPCCKAYREVNRDKVQARGKSYYQENKEQILVKHAAWRSARPDYQHQYYHEHIEKSSIQSQSYYKAHAEIIKTRKRIYYQEHTTEILKIRKEYQQAHVEQIEAYRKRHYQAHAERFKREKSVYYQENREQVRERARRFRKNNPQHMRSLDRVHSHKRRALKRSAPGTYTAAQIAEQLKRQHYRCYYLRCGRAKFPRDKEGMCGYQFHIEHSVPLSRTECDPRNDMSNIVLSCEQCNLEKHNKLPHEWFEGGRLF